MINSNKKEFYLTAKGKGHIGIRLFTILIAMMFLNYSNPQMTNTKNNDCDMKSFSIGECYQKCRIDYYGERNFFNRTDGICYKTLKCNSNEEYDISTNSCRIPLKDYINNLPAFNPGNFADNKPSSENSDGKISIPKINCINGFIRNKSTLCICYTGYTDSADVSKDSLNKTSLIMKCDKVIDGFSNSTSKNPYDQNSNNSNSTNSNTIQKPGQNTFIPDFIVKNSSLSANGLIDNFNSNITGINGNQTNSSNNINNSDSNISSFIPDGIGNQSIGISPILIIIICISCACLVCCFSCILYFLCRNRKNNNHNKLITTQNFPQFTITDLNNNNNNATFNKNINKIGNYNFPENENDIERDLNYNKFPKRQSNIQKENDSNLNNQNFFFNPQKNRSYNFFEQDLKQRNLHRRNLSNDALLNNISSRDYSSINYDYNNENDKCNQTFTDYIYTNNNNDFTNRNIRFYNINNNPCCDGNLNAYENSMHIKNSHDISCKNLITSDDFSDKYSLDKSIHKPICQEEHHKYDNSIIPLNYNPNYNGNIGNSNLRAEILENNNVSNRNHNKKMNSYFKPKEPFNVISRENPERRNLINPAVARKLNLEENNNFLIKNCFTNINPSYINNDSENVNCEYITENTNNIDTSLNLKNNLRLAEFNKFKNQGMSYSYQRPCSLIFRKKKGSNSMNFTNRTESYFLGEDISEDEDDMSFDKSNNKSFINNVPSPYTNSKIIPESKKWIGNRSNRKIKLSNKKNYRILSDFKRRSNSDNYIDKSNDIHFNVPIDKDDPFQDPIKKRSYSSRIINSNYSKKLNIPNFFKYKNNHTPLSNGIKTQNIQIDKNPPDEFYYNEDLDEFNDGIEIGKSVNGNNNCIPKINSIRNFDTAENNFFNNKNQYYNSSANNAYFNNNFLNTNFHEETENYNNINNNNFINSKEDEFAFNNSNINNWYVNPDNKVNYTNKSNNSKVLNRYKNQGSSNFSNLKDINGNKIKIEKNNLVGFYSENKIPRRNRRNSVCFDINQDNRNSNENLNIYISAKKRGNSVKKPHLQQSVYERNRRYKSNSNQVSHEKENKDNFCLKERINISKDYYSIDENQFNSNFTPNVKSNVKYLTSVKKPIGRRLTYNDF